MIRYRKNGQVKFFRSDLPEPPFFGATIVSPYSFPRSEPLALDYVRLIGTAGDRLDVAIAVVPDFSELGPIVIDSTEAAELIYRRGEVCHRALRQKGDTPIIQLISTLGAVPEIDPSRWSLVVLCAWPLHLKDLDRLARSLSAAGLRWGLGIPILFPATTAVEVLSDLARVVEEHRGDFLTGIRFELDPPARRALASMVPTDDETYSTLFDQGAETVAITTERHIAALAAERSLKDAILPPDHEEHSNWNAAALASIAGYRLIQMGEDVELGWALMRNARRIASLPKPLTRIASAANLSIVEGLLPELVDALDQWIAGEPAEFLEQINRRWRLRRDYAV